MPNRTLCSVLDAMRDADKTKNYSYMLGLIEEAQYLANRMEAALWNQKDFNTLSEKVSALNKELKELEAKKKFIAPEESKPASAGIPFNPYSGLD